MNKNKMADWIDIHPAAFEEMPRMTEEWREAVAYISTDDLEKIPLHVEPGRIGNVREEKRGNNDARKGMMATYNEHPELFAAKHNGIVVSCSDFRESPTQDGGVRLFSPALVDGAQTQDFFRSNAERKAIVFTRILHMVDQTSPKWADTGVAHNTSSSPAKLSRMGKLGMFESLEEAFGSPLQKSETDARNHPHRLDTRLLIANLLTYTGTPAEGQKTLTRYEKLYKSDKSEHKEQIRLMHEVAYDVHWLANDLLECNGFKSFREWEPRYSRAAERAGGALAGPKRKRCILVPALWAYGGCDGFLQSRRHNDPGFNRTIQTWLLATAKDHPRAIERLTRFPVSMQDAIKAHLTIKLVEKNRAAKKRANQ